MILFVLHCKSYYIYLTSLIYKDERIILEVLYFMSENISYLY